MYEHLLIDGRNAIYRALYAGLSSEKCSKCFSDNIMLGDTQNFCGSCGHKNNPDRIDPALVFFRFLCTYVQRFKPAQIHFFWDAPKAEIWRKRIMTEYKDGRDTSMCGKYANINIDKMLTDCTTVCQELITKLNSRNYIREKQEADDLIFAFCRLRHEKMLIVSSDGDFKQVSYLFSHVDVFSPLSKTNEIHKVEHSEPDPVIIKSLMGEKSDNIRGYNQIGPVRAKQLAIDPNRKAEFLKVHGDEIYLRNRALIDLTLCPYLLHNMTYIEEVLAEQSPTYDIDQIRQIIQKYKVKGLMGEVSKILLPFKFIGVKQETSNGSTLRRDSTD